MSDRVCEDIVKGLDKDEEDIGLEGYQKPVSYLSLQRERQKN